MSKEAVSISVIVLIIILLFGYVAKKDMDRYDKCEMAGRHGNKGVVSVIMPVEDMPHDQNGEPFCHPVAHGASQPNTL
jgi:hypothetical protein